MRKYNRAFLLALIMCGIFLCSGFTTGTAEGEKPVEYWREGDFVSPETFSGAASLSAGVKLELDMGKNLFFSNVPEFPGNPGILARADNVVSKSGDVRVLYSHCNNLTDYSTLPYQVIPAKIGLIFINQTPRTVDVYKKRFASGVSRMVDGRQYYVGDSAPARPGSKGRIYYGTYLGNVVLAKFFASNPTEREQYWTSIAPGGRAWLFDGVGPGGWAIGMGDFVFRDGVTGEGITTGTLSPGEGIGVRCFISRNDMDLDTFYKATDHPAAVLNQSANEHLHMRGLYTGGIFPNSPDGEGVTRKKAFNYDSSSDGKKTITLNAKQKYQNLNPAAPFYEPTMFLNDILRNGFDAYGRVENDEVISLAAENNGSYGADYEFTLTIKGPAAIAVQGCVPLPGSWDTRVWERPPVDLYNQFLTTMLDAAPENVRTLRLVDPHYFDYYTGFEKLGPLGSGKVAYVFPGPEEKTHVLKLALPANGYGPYKVMLMPLEKGKQAKTPRMS